MAIIKSTIFVRYLFCIGFIFLYWNPMSAQASIQWIEDRAISVSFDADLATEDLSVSLKGQDTPLLGQWDTFGEVCIFRPALPFRNGISYELRSKGKSIFDFAIEAKALPAPTMLTAIYPSTRHVPENLLKIHLYFSGQMGEEYSQEFITVTNNKGDTIPDIFLPLQPELWNARRDHLTLWLDPGRIKRGLSPNIDLGSPLTDGETYRIHISSKWKDKYGRPLAEGFETALIVREADRNKINAGSFTIINLPSSLTSTPLTIDCKEPLDYALAHDCFLVSRGETVLDGTMELDNTNQILTFTPAEPWQPGDHILKINARLEDLAGNNLNHLFDKEISGDVGLSDFYYMTFHVE